VVFADISSISILRTSLLAGLGRTVLPLMPLRQEIEAGLLRATAVIDPPLERMLAICWSKHIPTFSASQAVARLARQLIRQLCADRTWLGACVVLDDGDPN
jgi:LysR family nitrogen assimilation transcriptional regulator